MERLETGRGEARDLSRPTDVLVVSDENAWEDYLWWPASDHKILKGINALLLDIQRNGNEVIGQTRAAQVRLRRRLVQGESPPSIGSCTRSPVTRSALPPPLPGQRPSAPVSYATVAHFSPISAGR